MPGGSLDYSGTMKMSKNTTILKNRILREIEGAGEQTRKSFGPIVTTASLSLCYCLRFLTHRK
jgi:hypothetical protein